MPRAELVRTIDTGALPIRPPLVPTGTGARLKALTLTQPWASLVAWGEKRIETRSWTTAYRGPIAIHAATNWPAWARHCCDLDIFREALLRHDRDPSEIMFDLPRGQIVAVATLEHIRPTGIEGQPTPMWVRGLRPQERAFGDYSPGRYGWFLSEVRLLPEPIPCSGAQRLWHVPGEMLERIQEGLPSEP